MTVINEATLQQTSLSMLEHLSEIGLQHWDNDLVHTYSKHRGNLSNLAGM